MTLQLDRPALMGSKNIINGQWASSVDSTTYAVVDPATGVAFANAPDSQVADAVAAVDSAADALSEWRALTARARAQILKRWYALIVANCEDLARLISREQGKPITESRGEVLYGAAYIEWFAEEAVRAYGELIPEPNRGKKLFVLKEPVGVVAAVTPWNFPFAMLARKVAPALAAGCTVVAKPAEDTPLTALAMAWLAQEAGLPPGVFNVVTASRARTPEVVGAWVSDPRVRKVSFTGSTEVGKTLARNSAATLKKVSLELGGNAPFIVFDDADIDAAVEGLMAAKFRNGGQTCVSPNRVYVQTEIYEHFASKLVARVSALTVGAAVDQTAHIGPMINERALNKIIEHVADARAQGAVVLAGGSRVEPNGTTGTTFFAPTVLGDATKTMRVAQEETFGPVVTLFRFRDEADVLQLSNDTPYGLAAYFYTQNISRVWRVADRLEAGMIGINEGVISAESAPFGGIKQSGYGREGSRHGLDDYMHTKYCAWAGWGQGTDEF